MRELIFILKKSANIDELNKEMNSPSIRRNNFSLTSSESNKINVEPIFDIGATQPTNLVTNMNVKASELSKYYKVNAKDEELERLEKQFRNSEFVEDVYIKPDTEHAVLVEERTVDTLTNTEDFTSRQGYLDEAPAGIDAKYSWNVQGGKGKNVKVIDIEGAWRFSHEDLIENQGGVIGGSAIDDLGWRNHGTAVLGVISGDDNRLGITGISPDAKVSAISFSDIGTSKAIFQAANALNAGDIILIELHRAGPRLNYENRSDQRGYIAIEWWQDDFEAIRYATSKGVIVVEAAGNGAENLDDVIYENKFNRTYRDSGAILVGAGAPPPGTHNMNHGPDRSRLDFSNYGSIIDAQGWGREVTTTGYGDLQSGENEDKRYTDIFSGTSSASPIIVGTLACLQGILKHRGESLLAYTTARKLLRDYGSPQQDSIGRPISQRIGNRPNLKQLINVINENRGNITD